MKNQTELSSHRFRSPLSVAAACLKDGGEMDVAKDECPSRWLPVRRPPSTKLSWRGILCVTVLLPFLMVLARPPACAAQVAIGISVGIAPPALPIYTQPLCPGPGYIWTPGYWAWDPSYGYYWVPGTWVLAPFPGALWTPGYWGWNNGGYFWNAGYWGPVVGFYGGINYGFGYTGYGYQGGYWRGRNFYYNRAVNRINITTIRNVYNTRVINRTTVNRVSYNGGPHGVAIRATAAQLAAARHRRVTLTSSQRQQELTARSDPRERASVNRGRPAVAATARPGAFTGRGVVQARSAGAPYRAPSRPAVRRPAPRTANPAGGGRHQLITAPGHGAPARTGRSVPSRGTPPRTSPATPRQAERSMPSRGQPARGAYRPRTPQNAGPPRYNAAPRQEMRRPTSPRPETRRSPSPRPQVERRQAPQQQRAPHPPERSGPGRQQPHEPHM